MTDVLKDAVEFAHRVLRVKVWSHQEGPLRATAANVIWAGGRRSGKSEGGQIKAIHVAATNAACMALVVHPSIDSARSWLREAADILRDSKIRDSVLDEEAQVIRFSNRSEIRVVPATAGQLRGRGRNLLLAIVEEAGFHDPSVVRDLRYTLLDNLEAGAQMWQIGSPWGGVEHPFRSSFLRGLEGDEDFASFHAKTSDNPTLPAGYLERERMRLPPSEAAAELDGEWSEAAGSLWPRELIDRQSADIHIPALSELRGPAMPILACDWGVSYDTTATITLYRLPVASLNADTDPLPRFLALPHVWPAKTPLHACVKEIVASPAPFRYVSTELNGVGAMPSQELVRRMMQRRSGRGDDVKRNWNKVTTTSATKTAGHTAVLGLAERGQLVFPRHPALLRQLAGLRFEQGARGFLKIEAESAAVHDDVCDALMLAALPYRRPGGVVCHLLRLADPTRAVPDATTPELDCEVVATGGGLRVYKHPILQSAGGSEVTLPDVPLLTRRAQIAWGDYMLKTH